MARNVDLKPLYPCVVAIDVHQAKLTVCVLYDGEDGRSQVEIREFGGFKRDRQAMAQWIASFNPALVVMESTGIYWKSPYAALEKWGIAALVVNARPVKQVPGRKTDIADAPWLAILARSGLLSGGFVPPAQFRELRLVSPRMQKRTGILAGEKNRLHKVLTDAGIRISVVVSDIHGKSARRMSNGLIAGETPQQVLDYARDRLKATPEELLDALDGEMTDTHRFVLTEIMEHIEDVAKRIEEMRRYLLAGLAEQEGILPALQTIPGLDRTSAAMLLVEIGDDMDAFGSPAKRASWAGGCPGNNESAGKRKSGKQRKGNPDVRRILCEAANAASRTHSELAEKFNSLFLRRGRNERFLRSPIRS